MEPRDPLDAVALALAHVDGLFLGGPTADGCSVKEVFDGTHLFQEVERLGLQKRANPHEAVKRIGPATGEV